MTFFRKAFLALFLSLLILGSGLIGAAHHYFQSTAEEEFTSRYSTFANILAGTLSRLDSSTEGLMLNAAKVVAEEEASRKNISTDRLRSLQHELGVTHIFITDKNGNFIRSTNEEPARIPNLFSFCDSYRNLILGKSDVEATPVVKPKPEPKPHKFLMIANKAKDRIIEVGVRVDFIARTLAEAVATVPAMESMSLYASDGTPFGTYADDHVTFSDQKIEVPADLSRPVWTGESAHFFTRVASSHPDCCQCQVPGRPNDGNYHYVLESNVSTKELKKMQARVTYICVLVAILNALVSLAIAHFLSRRLVRNIQTAVRRVRELKASGEFSGRIGLSGGDEVAYLTGEFDHLLDTLDESQKELVAAQRVRSKVELAQVVAHNIKSPVLALEMTIPALTGVPEKMLRVLNSAVREIKDLSEKLKTQSDGMIAKTQNEIETDIVHVPLFLSDLVASKRAEYSQMKAVSIHYRSMRGSESPFVRVSSSELRGVLSNLINNAVESYGDKGGHVDVELSVADDSVSIGIHDSGQGIPGGQLTELGARPFSTKAGGRRGVGLIHAFRATKVWGGSIEVESAVGCGTSIVVRLPRCQPAPVSVRSVKLWTK